MLVEITLGDRREALAGERLQPHLSVVDHQRHRRTATRPRQDRVGLNDVHFGLEQGRADPQEGLMVVGQLHADQVARYGLRDRVAGIRSINANIPDYMAGFASADRKVPLQRQFEDEARRLIDAGADVIVPTGGLPMMMFAEEAGAAIDGVPIVNGVTVLVKAAEMAVKLSRLTGHVASRAPHSGYVLPSAQALEEFLQHG